MYITLGLVSGTLIVGILVPNIEVVLTITGAVIGIFLCFIFPSVLFITAGGNEQMKRGAQVSSINFDVSFINKSVYLLKIYTLPKKDY